MTLRSFMYSTKENPPNMKLQFNQFLNAARAVAFFTLATTSILNAQLGTNRTLSVNPSATNQTAPTGNATQGSISPTISEVLI